MHAHKQSMEGSIHTNLSAMPPLDWQRKDRKYFDCLTFSMSTLSLLKKTKPPSLLACLNAWLKSDGNKTIITYDEFMKK